MNYKDITPAIDLPEDATEGQIIKACQAKGWGPQQTASYVRGRLGRPASRTIAAPTCDGCGTKTNNLGSVQHVSGNYCPSCKTDIEG